MPGQSTLRSFRPFSPDGLRLFANAVRRSTDSSPIVLSEGAIIGIAVASGLAVFGALTFIVICCIRKRHRNKRRTSGRRIDLGDDDEFFPVDTAARVGGDPIGTSVLAKPSLDESDPKMNEWRNMTQSKPSPENESRNLIPPAYSFHVTGIRDSWPLVAWTTTPELGAIDDPNIPPAVATRSPEGSSSLLGLAPSDPYHYPQAAPYPQPQAFPVRPIEHHGAPIQAKHSRQTSRSSTNALKRKSSTDNQLTTILCSTSQRLRDAQAAAKVEQPRSKVRGLRTSVLAPISGLPPSEKAPSPQRDQISSWKRHSLVGMPGSPGDSCCNSIKSSVLDLFSPRVNASPTRNPSTAKATRESTQPENPSDDDDADSLYSMIPDVAVPAALTSPSKRGNRSPAERRLSRVSSTANTGTKIHEDNRASLAPFGARNNFATKTKFAQTKSLRTKDRKVRQVPTGDDPFVTKGTGATHAISALPIRRDSQPRKTTFGEEFPLRAVSGNSQGPIPEPTKVTPRNASSGAATQPPNPFLFNTRPIDLAKLGPSNVNVGEQARNAKGHKRSVITRVSSLPANQRNSGIAIVPEEPENNKITNISLETLTSPPESSPTSFLRPPSLERFSPVITVVPQARGRQTLPARSHYSATLSLYDCYGPDVGTPLASPPRSPAASPKRSPNRYRQRSSSCEPSEQRAPRPSSLVRPCSRHDSVISTGSRRSSLTRTPGVSFVIPAAQIAKEQEQHQLQQQQQAAALSAFGLVGPPPPKRRSTVIRGPRAPTLLQPQPLLEPRESVQYSVGLLRRMNSVSSTLDEANTPVILPAYRSGGWGDGRYMAPAKKGRWSGAGGEWRENGMVTAGAKRDSLFEGPPGGNALGLWAPVPRQSWMVVEEEGPKMGPTAALAGTAEDGVGDVEGAAKERDRGRTRRPSRYSSNRTTAMQQRGSVDAQKMGPPVSAGGSRMAVPIVASRESYYDDNGFLVNSPRGAVARVA